MLIVFHHALQKHKNFINELLPGNERLAAMADDSYTASLRYTA